VGVDMRILGVFVCDFSGFYFARTLGGVVAWKRAAGEVSVCARAGHGQG